MLFVAMTLSTSAIAMDEKSHLVIIHNDLPFSVNFNYPNPGMGSNAPYLKFYILKSDFFMVPIPMRNNFESIPCKLSIPTGLGKEVSFDIPLIKEKEVIRISCPNPKSRHIIISKNDMINFAETNILQ